MATRTIPLAVYATDGSLYTSETPPTATVQYGSGSAVSATLTQRGNGWSVDVDDTQDALVLISGTGIQADHLIVPRIPGATIATATRSELATELAHLDASVSDAVSAAQGNVPTEWATVTHATVVDGSAIGVTTPGATVTAYLAADLVRATPKRQAVAEPDGEWSIRLTPGAAYLLDFEKDGYATVTKEVTV